MNAIASAFEALFLDDNIATDAIYTAGGGSPVLVRVVARRADSITGFGEAKLWSETRLFDLRVSEVANPRPGDRLEIGGEAFLIQGEPVRDPERLIWTIDVHPA
jgi:hypothetical protein